MPYPSYNPTLVLMESVKEQGYQVDPAPGLSIANSKYPMGDYPLGDTSGDPMADYPPSGGPTFEQALKHQSPGDSALPKFTPYSSDQGF